MDNTLDGAQRRLREVRDGRDLVIHCKWQTRGPQLLGLLQLLVLQRYEERDIG